MLLDKLFDILILFLLTKFYSVVSDARAVRPYNVTVIMLSQSRGAGSGLDDGARQGIRGRSEWPSVHRQP